MAMRLILILLTIATAAAYKRCGTIQFDGKFYNVHILKEGLNHIRQLILNRNDNTLYFIFEQMAFTPTTALGYFNIDSKETGVIDIRNASGIAIDQERDRVYAGGDEGIFLINNRGKIPEELPVRDKIKTMFYKDGIYYANDRKTAYKLENDNILQVFELYRVGVDNLLLDDDDNIFFLQENNMFKVKLGTRLINKFEGYHIEVITTDAYYRPFVVASDGVYVYNKYKYIIDKVSHLRNLKGLTFTKKNDPIYVVNDVLVMLNKTTPCYEPKF